MAANNATHPAQSGTRSIRVDMLARVEGEGALTVKISNGAVRDVQFRIFEPPRFFEGFLRGRDYREVPDITARICGICPVAYQMSAVHALEAIFGVQVGGALRVLRRLLYCGEWIESHALHIFMLHAPDFLGYNDAIEIAKDHPEIVKEALFVKKTGNELMRVVGGREIHPINVRVGGFYRAPERAELVALLEPLKQSRDIACGAARWLATFDFPDLQQDTEYVALRHPDEYPMNEGRIVSTGGIDIPVDAYEQHFSEEHVRHSTALHGVLNGDRRYAVGPLARFNLNYDRLSPLTLEVARDIGFAPPCTNPFQSIVARALETIYALDEAIRLIEDYRAPAEAAVPVEPRAGTGHGCTEAPRGILYHRYTVDGAGLVTDAKIVPPTAQNQKMIESDLRQVVAANLELPDDALTARCEQAVRNYDPCISCATHFLKLVRE
jgi:coenzyme F420-reducing hydrogenase alpha subunit